LPAALNEEALAKTLLIHRNVVSMSKCSTAVGHRFRDEQSAYCLFPNITTPRRLLGDVVRASFHTKEENKGGSKYGNCRLNHESADTADDEFFG
jgi:hypothetical protein